MPSSSGQEEDPMGDGIDMVGRGRSSSLITRLRSISKISSSSHSHAEARGRSISASVIVQGDGGCCIQGVDNFGYAESTTEKHTGKGLVLDSRDNNDEASSKSVTEGAATLRMDSTSSKEDVRDEKKMPYSVGRYKGVGFAFLSTILLSFSTMAVALLAGSVGSNEVVFTQTFIQLLFCIPMSTVQKVSFRMSRQAFMLVLYRSIVGSIANLLAYFAFQVMPVGNAKAIIYSSPIFTGLFSCLILHEACTALDVVFSFLTLSGVMLVIQPPFIFGGDESTSSILGPIFSLICAVLVGTIYIALRKLGPHRVNTLALLIIYSLISMTISSVVATLLQEWVIPRCGTDRILLILTGTLTFLTQVSVTLAVRYEKATTVSLIRTSDVFFTFVLEYFFFGTIPNYITITGAICIVGSLTGITLRKWWSEKRRLQREEKEEVIDDQLNDNHSIKEIT